MDAPQPPVPNSGAQPTASGAQPTAAPGQTFDQWNRNRMGDLFMRRQPINESRRYGRHPGQNWGAAQANLRDQYMMEMIKQLGGGQNGG